MWILNAEGGKLRTGGPGGKLRTRRVERKEEGLGLEEQGLLAGEEGSWAHCQGVTVTQQVLRWD